MWWSRHPRWFPASCRETLAGRGTAETATRVSERGECVVNGREGGEQVTTVEEGGSEMRRGDRRRGIGIRSVDLRRRRVWAPQRRGRAWAGPSRGPLSSHPRPPSVPRSLHVTALPAPPTAPAHALLPSASSASLHLHSDVPCGVDRSPSPSRRPWAAVEEMPFLCVWLFRIPTDGVREQGPPGDSRKTSHPSHATPCAFFVFG